MQRCYIPQVRSSCVLVAASLVTAAFFGGCSSSKDQPVVEYPEAGSAGDVPGVDAAVASDAGADAAADAPAPVNAKQLLTGSVFIEGVTSDGSLVFDDGKNVNVLPAGATTPVLVVADYDPGTDSLLVRGRFVAAWLGNTTSALPLVLWAKTGGVQTIAPLTYRDSFYPRNAADDFAYTTAGGSLLRRNVWATKAGTGAGTKVVAELDTGLTNAPCRPTITWTATSLLVAGCANGVTTAKVDVYALDGTGPTRTVLDGSAPGIWPDHARTHALVQTSTASSVRALSGAASVVPLDGPVKQAAFSSDDTKVVFLHGDGKVKRAATTAPAAPVELLGAAISLLAISSDARFTVVATKGDPTNFNSDLIVCDATTPATPRTIAAEKAAFIGVSRSGTHAIWLADRGIGLEGALYTALLPNGAPQKLSMLAERVTLDGDVVYWQEFDPASKSNVLKAAQVATGAVTQISQGLDALTAQTVVVGKSLFVASKLGLWEYPALTQ